MTNSPRLEMRDATKALRGWQLFFRKTQVKLRP